MYTNKRKYSTHTCTYTHTYTSRVIDGNEVAFNRAKGRNKKAGIPRPLKQRKLCHYKNTLNKYSTEVDKEDKHSKSSLSDSWEDLCVTSLTPPHLRHFICASLPLPLFLALSIPSISISLYLFTSYLPHLSSTPSYSFAFIPLPLYLSLLLFFPSPSSYLSLPDSHPLLSPFSSSLHPSLSLRSYRTPR